MAQLLKRIIKAEVDAVWIPDLPIPVFLRHKGDSRDLLALDVKGKERITVPDMCRSFALDRLLQTGALTLYDETGAQLTGLDMFKATNVATLKDSGTGGGPVAEAKRLVQESILVAQDSQTVFTLLVNPSYPESVMMFVNGNKETYGTSYTVAGQTVTWIGSGFDLKTSDQITFVYEKTL